MPASDISRLSIAGVPRCNLAAQFAKESAHREIGRRIQIGEIDRFNTVAIEKEFKAIYMQEYYRHYAQFLQQDQQSRIVYVATENPSARKYYCRHTVVRFSKLNCFIHVHRDCITVGRINYPIDEEISPETKEAFLAAWPGPLDRADEWLKRRVTDYIDTLWQHDSQRRIRYSIGTNDDQRKTILRLLTELLHRNGTIDAPGITRLLLRSDQTEIQKDEGSRKPLDTLQKYLLLGKRSEAIKFAKSKKLWEHAQCLAFLDKYQPPNTEKYMRDGTRLKDDSIVQLNDEYISALENAMLTIVYRSLLNRILQSDPESVNIVKHTNVANNPYEFALLSANDCDMEFDQTNETFKLIVAVKQAILNPALANSHLISLGLTTIDSYDPNDDLSYRSHLSFKQGDTFASRTLTISNIDMLILNEIWEYCLNLARGTNDPASYNYIIDLVPYKLIFASRLLDFGLHGMFADYLSSIKNALFKVRSQPYQDRDSFYDWTTIESSVDHMSRVWDIFRMSNETLPRNIASPESIPLVPVPNPSMELNYNPPPSFNTLHSLPTVPAHQQNEFPDFPDSTQYDYPSLPYQHQNEAGLVMNQNIPPPRGNIPPLFNQRPIQEEEEVTDFNPEPEPLPPAINERSAYNQQPAYNDYAPDTSRRPSMDMPPYSPPSFGPPGMSLSNERPNQKAMTSSSPVHKGRDSIQSNQGVGDSFNSPYSPINEYDDLPNNNRDMTGPPLRDTRPSMDGPILNASPSRHNPLGAGSSSGMNSHANNTAPAANSNSNNNNSSNSNNKSQPPAGDQQQSGILTHLFGSAKALLPKSNSKQMILPDDSKKTIVYDDKKGWVDTTEPEGVENANTLDAPPMMPPVDKAPNYSFVKSSKSRYPKATF